MRLFEELDWVEINRGRQMAELSGAVKLIVPDFSSLEQIIPLCCPLCETVHRGRDDEHAFQSFGCCHMCAMEWAWPDKAAWLAGNRPPPEQIKIAVAARPPLALPRLND